MKTEYDFEFEPTVPLSGQKPITLNVEPPNGEKSDAVEFSPTQPIISNAVDSVKNATDKVVTTVGAAAVGATSRMAEIRKLFSILVSSGVDPSAAADLAAKQVLANEATAQVRPAAQPAGSTSAQIMEQGKMTSGDKWAKKIGGPGGETAQQAYENYRLRNKLAQGETLLRSGLVLPAGSNVRDAVASTIPDIVKKEAVEKAAREAVAAKGASKSGMFSNLLANTPGFVGKFLGGAGGAAAGYQGYEAIQAMKAAQNNPEKLQAILDMLSAAGSGAAALPIPGAQLPGLALGMGIPAAGYVGRKIADALPDYGFSEEARRAVR
jgi:hypothetical protein